MRSLNKLTLSLVALFLVLSHQCYATASISTPTPVQSIKPTVPSGEGSPKLKNDDSQSLGQQLAQIKSQIVLINAQVARADALNKLKAATGSNSAMGDGVNLPVLKSIYGHDAVGLEAELEIHPGETVEAKAGDHLVGGLSVVKITPTGITLIDTNMNHYSLFVTHNSTLQPANASVRGYIPAPMFK